MTADVTTWIVAADGRNAHIFEERRRHGPLHEIPELARRFGEADRPPAHAHGGTVHSRAGDGRSNMYDADPDEAAERRFLTALARDLDAAAVRGAFKQLVLFAPPRALGVLRGALKPATARLVEVADAHDRTLDGAEALRSRLRDVRIPA
ncbi:MAG: host attachment protein [Phenylobacterium sp.]|uniref:host attachment protein n=1 Tax=Phenylobacterium sp. TaxID=1871053 RepID=UPI00391CFE7A